MTISRPPLWATLFTILGIAILCILGTWQLQRLEWKAEILDKIAQEAIKDPAQYPLSKDDLFNPDLSYTKGSLTGHFAQGSEIFLKPRTYEGQIGFHVMTPFILEDGTQVLVNRGWHPEENKMESLPVLLKTTITGIAAKPPRRNSFTPKNVPETNQWYWPDIAEIARTKKLDKIAPVIFYQEYGQDCCLLKPVNPASPNNNHFQYACFWFAMAGALIVIYIFRFIISKVGS